MACHLPLPMLPQCLLSNFLCLARTICRRPFCFNLMAARKCRIMRTFWRILLNINLWAHCRCCFAVSSNEVPPCYRFLPRRVSGYKDFS